MRKKYVIMLVVLLVIVVALAWICVEKHFEKTECYDLKELERYFQDAKVGDALDYNEKMLHRREVDQQYSAKIVRGREYSVYDVKQGGRFYVFWMNTLYTQIGNPLDDAVYSTIYIHNNKSADKFDSLQPGKATAEDVKAIDPDVAFNFSLSHAVYSCSYLNKEEVLQIKYQYDGSGDYAGLVVEEIKVVPRTSSYTHLAWILSEDLP